MSRTRLCNNPQPSRGGKPCIGSGTETVNCKTPSCIQGKLLNLFEEKIFKYIFHVL
jgi:hypothetical protein